jgi:hypothetical protein
MKNFLIRKLSRILNFEGSVVPNFETCGKSMLLENLGSTGLTSNDDYEARTEH